MKVVLDTRNYLAGEVLSKAVPFLLMPFFTRIFNADEFAEYTLFYSFYLLFFYLLVFCQDGSIARYYIKYGQYAQFNLLVIGHLMLFGISLFIGALIHLIDFKTEAINWVLFSAISNSLFSIQLRMRHCRFQSTYYLASQAVAAVGVLSLTLYFAHIQKIGPTSFFIAASIIYVLAFFVLSLDLMKTCLISTNIKKYVSIRLFRYLVFFGLAGVVHQLSFFSKGHVDRFIIYSNFSSEEIATYGASTQIAAILSVILMAVNKGLTPYAYKAMKAGKLDKLKIQRYTKLSVLYTPLPAFMCFLVPQKLFTLLLGTGFEQAKHLTMLFIISISCTLPYLVMVAFLFYHGKHMAVTIISLVTALLHILILFAFVSFDDINLFPVASIIVNFLMVGFVWLYLEYIYEK